MNPQGNDQIKGMAVTQFVKIFEWIKVVSRKSFQLDQALGGGVGGEEQSVWSHQSLMNSKYMELNL